MAGSSTPTPDGGEARAPVDLGRVPVPSGSGAVLRTTCATHPCPVCWLRDRIARSGDAPDYELSSDPLDLNIVGVRQESSVSDSFDDAMVALCRVLPGEQRGDYEKAVEEEIRERLRGLDHSRARLVPCTHADTRGLWLVAVYEHVTTDPGMEARRDDVHADRVRKARELRRANEQRLSELDVEIDRKKAEVAAAARPRDQRRAAAELRRLEAEETKREAWREKLDQRVERAEAEQERLQERRDAGRSSRELRLRDGSRPGWLAQGRAIMSPGLHEEDYRYRLHKGLGGHVALAVGYLYYEGRMYSAGVVRRSLRDWARQDARRESKKGKAHYQWEKEKDAISVAEYVPFGGSEREFAEGDARVTVRDRIETTARGRERKVPEAVLVTRGPDGETETVLDDRDVLVVRARIGGTNIHRAHNTVFRDGRVVGVVGKGDLDDDRVRNWSQGCQTYRSPHEFEEFLRLCAVSHRWRCTRADASKIGAAGCRAIEPSPAGSTELSEGERALEDAYGASAVSSAVAERYRKEAAKKLPAVQRCRSEVRRLEAEQEELRERFVAMEERRAYPLEWSDEDEVASAELEAELGRNERELAAAQKALAQATPAWAEPRSIADELEGESASQAELEGLDGDDGSPLSVAWAEKKVAAARSRRDRLVAPGSRAKDSARADAEEALHKREALLERRRQRAEELRGRKGLRPGTAALRHDFLRDRVARFGSDHLRLCQVAWDGCPVRFDYLLIELSREDRDELVDEVLRDRRCGEWDGSLVLGGPA